MSSRGIHVYAREPGRCCGGAAGRVVSRPVRIPTPALVGRLSVDQPLGSAPWVPGGTVCAAASRTVDAAASARRVEAADGRSRHCSGRNGPAPGAAATARANAVGLTGRRSIGKTAGSWKALETRWKVLWTAAAVVVVLGCVGIATEANDGSSPGASSAGAGNGATGGLSPAGQQVQQDGYGSIQQTSVNGLPVALGTNSSGGQELVETWPNATQASEALASTQDTDVMTGNYANITGLSANGDLLIIDGSEEGIQYILSNTGISF